MRLIDADAFDERIRLDVGSCEEELTEDFKDGISTILEMMKTAPTVDVVPVAHGKWIQFPTLMAYKCSECGRVIQTTDGRRNVSKHYPFCHCGARMDGKDGDHHE